MYENYSVLIFFLVFLIMIISLTLNVHFLLWPSRLGHTQPSHLKSVLHVYYASIMLFPVTDRSIAPICGKPMGKAPRTKSRNELRRQQKGRSL